MAAISACHAGIIGSSPGIHPLASRFMAEVRRLRVPKRHLIPSWDPFEPLETVDIKFVSLKTALLLALTSSLALLKGVSVEDICKAASWSSRHTFIRFYMLDVAEPSFSS